MTSPAAQLYSPIVHATAFLTFLGWMAATGDWHRAIGIAIAVLIITCPCALGLAVPIVQVVAARRLFENGIMVKDGSGIERLAEADTIVFDKTGTLTLGMPRLAKQQGTPESLAIAAAIAAYSRHPLSRALAAAGRDNGTARAFSDITERAGFGLEASDGGDVYRLGRAGWALSDGEAGPSSGTVLSLNGRLLAQFDFEDSLRSDASETVQSLRDMGMWLEILSGDNETAVAATARRIGIDHYDAGLLPAEKVDRLQAQAAESHKVLMVGDGLNDAPALASAHVSMAPASAADIGRNAADFVFLREPLGAVPLAIRVAREAGTLVRQNFGLAIIYNAIALPIAIAGYVTPLVAALAMSLSSVLVVGNALRLKTGRGSKAERRVASPLSRAEAHMAALPR